MDNSEKISAVNRMKDYIQEYLTEQITLRALADAAGYSPWHAARMFKELAGKTPFEYIRAIRLSRAALKLRDDDVRITDVAFDFVFGSHEGFTRAFSREFGMTPKYYSKNQPLIKFFIPNDFRDYYLTIQKGVNIVAENPRVNTVFVQVVDRPARKLILKRGINATDYFEYCEEVGCDVWDMLTGIKEALYEPIGMWLPENMRKPGTSVYAQGVEVQADFDGKIPDGFDMVDLPSCKMMVFQGAPYDDDKFEQAITEVWEVMKSYDPKVYGFEWADEDGPRFQLAPMGYRGYIEARPVRQLNKK
jgi:AraC-like DNA-binding protein